MAMNLLLWAVLWDGLYPNKSYVEVPIPGPEKVTPFGDTVFREVISVSSNPVVMGVLIGRGNLERDGCREKIM